MEDNFERTALRVSAVSVWWNLALSLMKLAVGIAARSGAMVSDAVHSASDVFSSIIVILGVKLAGKEPDKEHPYGHERMECVAAILLSVLLAATGILIGYSAVKKLIGGEYRYAEVPKKYAMLAAAVSIIVKEAMFRYTAYHAKRIDSDTLMADAWHHRSDALSSVGALIGIGGAIMGFPALEPIASVLICVFIEKAAAEIFKDAVDKMVDKSCDDETEDRLRACALGVEGVLKIDLLRTRIFGSRVYVEMEIGADGNLTLKDSHRIAENVHSAVEKNFPKVKHITVHVNPADEESAQE